MLCRKDLRMSFPPIGVLWRASRRRVEKSVFEGISPLRPRAFCESRNGDFGRNDSGSFLHSAFIKKPYLFCKPLPPVTVTCGNAVLSAEPLSTVVVCISTQNCIYRPPCRTRHPDPQKSGYRNPPCRVSMGWRLCHSWYLYKTSNLAPQVGWP